MAQDGVEKGYGIAIVHETRVQADTPKRCGADLFAVLLYSGRERFLQLVWYIFLAVVLQHGHDEAVAGTDIVKEEVAIGMKLLIAERRWDGEGAAVDGGAGGSCGERLDVTNIAADLNK